MLKINFTSTAHDRYINPISFDAEICIKVYNFWNIKQMIRDTMNKYKNDFNNKTILVEDVKNVVVSMLRYKFMSIDIENLQKHDREYLQRETESEVNNMFQIRGCKNVSLKILRLSTPMMEVIQ